MDRDDVTLKFSAAWLFLPPFVAILTIVVTNMFATAAPVPVDEAVWSLVGLVFAILTILYGIFIQRGFLRGLLPVQIAAQGLLLCPLSLRMGAQMFQWIGVIMAVSGAVVLLFLYWQSVNEAHRVYVELPSSELDALPLPFATTDAQGNVVSVSDTLLQLTQKSREAAEKVKITELLPVDRETVALGGKEWKILQSPMKDNMHYFQLEEVRAPAVIAFSDSSGGILDPITSLYARSYAEKRVEEELYRVRRYHRRLSAALLRVVFLGSNSPDKETEIFNGYCRFVQKHTREADVACLAAPRDLLLVMPETQLGDAEGVVGKLADFVPHIQKELEGFDGAMDVRDGLIVIDSEAGDMNFDHLVEKLNETLGTK
ncbi:MAG: hypothetical protein LBD04_04510 [Synergistaceae bacterium]|jgi:hypothetical protein|nr:hypothetical protein [Synergistaceae bacterium]